MSTACRSLYCLMVLGGFAAMSSAAIAQEEASQDRANAQDEREYDVIIVTAQKQAQSIQDVAASISALSGEQLEERGISTPDKLQFAVPSVQVGTMRSSGGSSITIRGVGLNLFQASPAVALNINGIYQTEPAYGRLAQLDLERVEVLRGPQGTLYGRNANGGAINFITKAPEDTFGAELLVGYTEYGEQHLQTILNMPITSGIRGRLALDYSSREEGFTEHVAGGDDLDSHETISGRGSLSLDLSPDAVLDLSLTMSHQTGPTASFQLNSQPSALALASNPFLANANIALEPWTTTTNDPSRSEQDFMQGSATLTWDLGFAEFKSLSGYTSFTDDYQLDADSSDISAFLQTVSATSTAFSQEFNLSNSSDVLDWVLGFYYLEDNYKQRTTFDFPLGLGALPPGSYLDLQNPQRDTEARAIFADGTWHATDALNLIVGVRYSEEDYTYTYSGEAGLLVGDARIALFPTCPERTDTPSFTSFTPRVGLQYYVADDQNLYATVSKGYKSGGANVYACGNEFNPEQIVAYEAGYRSQWSGGDVTFNASAFYYDYTDLQLAQIANLANIITNADGAEVKGLEFEMAWRPDDHWRLNGNLSLLDATYSEFVNFDTIDPLAGPQDISGNTLNQAPKVSANVGVARTGDIAGFGRLTARADLSFRSKIYFREFNGPLDSQDAYTVANLALIWDNPGDTFSIRLFADNLTNEAYINQMGSSDAFGTRYVSYGAPRQIGVEFRARY